MVEHALWNGLPRLLLVREFGFEAVAGAFLGNGCRRASRRTT